VDFELTVEPAGTGELDSLQRWLRSEPEFRDRVQPLDAPPRPGQMGAGMDAVLVAIGPESAVSVLIASGISWLAHRRNHDRPAGTITLRVRRPDGGEVELSSTQVQSLTPEELTAQVEQLTKILLAGPDQP
jgi:hypothetical protein